jgi:negative regulator of flagellin synthesis FlgM
MKIGQNSEMPVASTPTAQSLTEAATKPNTARAQAEAVQAYKPESKSDKPDGVKVSISSQAQALETSSEDAAVDMAKVEAVRAEIQQGTYKVNPEAIADKLLANAQEMLQRSKN